MTNSVVTSQELEEERHLCLQGPNHLELLLEESHLLDVREEESSYLSVEEKETAVTHSNIIPSEMATENRPVFRLSQVETETIHTEGNSVLDTRPEDDDEEHEADSAAAHVDPADEHETAAADDYHDALTEVPDTSQQEANVQEESEATDNNIPAQHEEQADLIKKSTPILEEGFSKNIPISSVDSKDDSIQSSYYSQPSEEKLSLDPKNIFQEELKPSSLKALAVPPEPMDDKTPGDDNPVENDQEEEKSQKEEVYDVLVSVKPSTYNPMAFVANKSSERPSIVAFATLQKPSPLVKQQAALLNDAIQEEESFEEEEDAQNISSESLQGIKALDTTHDDTLLEDDDLNVSVEDDEFFKMVS